MNTRQKIRAVVALGLLIFWIISSFSGIILYFAADGPRSGQTLLFLGLQKRDWVEIHSWTGLIAIMTALLHVILEWPLLLCLTRELFRKKDASSQSCQ